MRNYLQTKAISQKKGSLRPAIKNYVKNVAGGAKIIGGSIKRAINKIF